jgi:hypothetical protein
MKNSPRYNVMMAERETLPTPSIATASFESSFPPKARIKNPARGKLGINHKMFSIGRGI